MPEYSSTTITPSDGVQVPGMNGSTSGNFLLSALKSYILSEKGLANGLASLDGNGKLLSSQLPDLADDVIVVDSYATLPATGTAGKIYITADNNKMYRWDPDLETPNYVDLSIDLTEYARIVDIQDGNIQAGVAVKAFQDAMGRAIITTYETKADASDLKDAIDRNSNRISNLEQEHGGYVPVNYRGTDAVPTGKAKYGLVESIVGKSRAWNQLVQNGNFASSDGWSTISSFPTYANNICTFSVMTTDTSQVYQQKDLVQGHSYLIAVSFKCTNSARIFFNGAYDDFNGTGAWKSIAFIKPVSTVSSNKNFALIGNVVGDEISFKDVIVRDLTLIFPEGVPATIAECVAKCPDLLKYDAYGTRMVDETVSGVKSTSINIWDEEWESGDISSSTGENVPSSSYIRGVNYYPCLPSTEYYGKAENKIYLLWYDIQKNYIGYTANGFQNTYKVSLENAYYFRISINATSYGNNVQVCLNSYADKTIYHPHILGTITLPTSVTLRSAGSVADTDELNVEVNGVSRRRQTTRVSNVYDLSELSWGYNSTFGFSYTSDLQDIVKKTTTGTELPSITCTYYNVKSRDTFQPTSQDITMDYSGASKGWILVGGENPTGYIVVALATESVTLLDPIENNTIQTEGGGTINTIQTQTPVIDNSLDVGYLAL